MKILDNGHKYLLEDNKTKIDNEILTFFKDEDINGSGYEGTTNQEVIRALIHRVKFLDNQKPNDLNIKIIKHLRYALVLHEMRHLERLVDKDMDIENIECNKTHFIEM